MTKILARSNRTACIGLAHHALIYGVSHATSPFRAERIQPPAIDDIILRGKWSDCVALQQESVRTPALREKIKRVCEAHISDPYEQRFHFWMKNVEL